MKISELIAALNKVTQIAGDIPVVLKEATTEAESVITSLGISLNPTSGETSGTVTLEHGPAPAETEPAPAEAETPPAAE